MFDVMYIPSSQVDEAICHQVAVVAPTANSMPGPTRWSRTPEIPTIDELAREFFTQSDDPVWISGVYRCSQIVHRFIMTGQMYDRHLPGLDRQYGKYEGRYHNMHGDSFGQPGLYSSAVQGVLVLD